MFEQQLFEPRSRFVLFDVSFELGNRISGKIQLKHQFAHLVVDEPSDGFDFQAVGVNDSDIFKIGVSLRVIPANLTLQTVDQEPKSKQTHFKAVAKSKRSSQMNPILN